MPTQHRGESAGNNAHHTSSIGGVQQAVPIARRAALQTMQHVDRLQGIQAAKGRLIQLETSQNLQAQTLELARMVEKVEGERNIVLQKSPTAQVQRTVPIARLAAFQTVQQFERLQTLAAGSSLTQSEIPRASDIQGALSQASGVSQLEEVVQGPRNGPHKSPTAQAQAVSIARQAAFQTVQQTERLQKIQATKSG